MSIEDHNGFLVCAIADAPLVVPGSVFVHSCSLCGVRLMTAPSGQEILKRHPTFKLLCTGCWKATREHDDILLPGTPEKVIEELKTSVPNMRRNRN